ncbi:MAG: FAD-binding oxidoreductase [Clostridium sp.]|nr:FAD-binding oxidoreductase [Clostridium sp.]MDU7085243.1 FAD-binding oxidoreductase [Clostridium sp.]
MEKLNFQGLTGHIVTRDVFSYEEDRKQWNRAIEKYPLAIVYCLEEEDIINAIIWARENKVGIRVRSGGHHYEGYSNGNDVLIIDVSRMNNIMLEKEKGVLTIQGGVRNRELYEATGKAGYPFPGGGCPTVGAVGFTLGGGWGYSARMFGLGCDSLIGAEIIDYKGEKIIVSEVENKELLWALKGAGGGNFGVVTSLTFKLPEKVQNATLINIDCPKLPKEDRVQLFLIYQQMFKTLDNRCNLKMAVYNSKEKGIGVKFTGIFYGTKKEANLAIMPIKEFHCDLCITMKYMSVFKVNEEIQDSHPDYESYKSGGRFVLRDYSREEAEELVSLIEDSAEGSTYAAISLYGLGGKVHEGNKKLSAFAWRDAQFIMGIQSVWEDSMYAQENRAWTVEKYNVIKKYTKGAFVNFPLAENESYLEDYYRDNKKRLKDLREKYDPYRIFGFEQGL